jgi:membrane dipeptidase
VELLREMGRLGVMPDLSHLSDRAAEQVLEMFPGRVFASHSNCRALLAPAGESGAMFQRHLTDRMIREIASRGGTVGLNLFSPFLIRGAVRTRRATIEEAVAHVERVCELTGSTRHVALGSDMDGGFAAERLPQGIDRPADLRRLAEALTRRGWTEEQLAGFAWRNLARALTGGE